MRYKINSPRVVHQTIEGETVIIDFESGAYYSADQVGAQVWELLEQGASLGEMMSLLAQHYHLPEADIAPALEQFLTHLQAETLISLWDETATPAPAASVRVSWPQGQQAFNPPGLHKYTDMQDLLLLDPIHEVDESGWPAPKPEENA